jgi:hypothetical protein
LYIFYDKLYFGDKLYFDDIYETSISDVSSSEQRKYSSDELGLLHFACLYITGKGEFVKLILDLISNFEKISFEEDFFSPFKQHNNEPLH